MDRVEGVPLDREVKIAPLVSLIFRNAGHIPGAASAELCIGSGAARKTILFSGDLGPERSALLSPPHKPKGADVVIVESTNGERRRDAGADPEETLAQIVTRAAERKEKVIMPCFALGRAQLLVHRLARLHARGLLRGLNVYVDSPMAVQGIESLYRNPEYLAPELRESVKAVARRFGSPSCTMCFRSANRWQSTAWSMAESSLLAADSWTRGGAAPPRGVDRPR